MSRRAKSSLAVARLAARGSCSILISVCLTLGALAPASRAETAVPAQAQADGGAFLLHAPAPAQPAGLCLVDTGVDVNPDTEGVVVERTAIDGGSGDDVSPSTHGTVLAMMAAAPANGWGMVGVAPGAVRIVSVRILESGQTSFPFSSYAAGITKCLEVQGKYDIKVINLSLGDAEPASSQALEALANAIERATDYGVAVVAAAGNDDGLGVEYPAAYPSVLSVGATDTQSGSFCSFSNRGAGLRLLAPGCDLDGADSTSGAPDFDYWQGTSESSAIAAAALTALESYRTDLGPAAAQEALASASGGVLNIAQTFRNAGLEAIVSAGETAAPSAPSASNSQNSPQSVAPSNTVNLTTRFPRPQARLERIKRRLELVLAERPSEAQAEVRLMGRRRHARSLSILLAVRGTFTTLALPTSGVRELAARYVDVYDVERASPWTTIALPRSRAARDRRRR